MSHENNKEKAKQRFVYLSILLLLIVFLTLPYSTSDSLSVGLTVIGKYNNNSVNTKANENVFIDAKGSTDVELTFRTSADTTNQNINITKTSVNPTNVDLSKPALDKYNEIKVSENLSTFLIYNIIKVFYTQQELNKANIDESSISVFYFNESENFWTELTTNLDWVNDITLNTTNSYGYSGSIAANVSRFGLYGLGGLLADDESCSSASQCSGGFCCSNLCKSSACPTGEPPPGGGGGGGIVQETMYEIVVFDEIIEVELRQGQTQDFFLDILNRGTKKLKLTLEVGRFENIISIEGKKRGYSFEIDSGKSETVKITFYAEETLGPDVYATELLITGESVDEEPATIQISLRVPIIIEVRTKERALFDVELEILEDYQEVMAGENIVAKIILSNLGAPEKVDAEIIYSIKDLDGNVIIHERDTLAAETVAEFTIDVELPSYLKSGTYVFDVTATYNGITLTDSRTFEIGEEAADVTKVIERFAPEWFVSGNLMFYLSGTFGLLLTVLLILNIVSTTQYRRGLMIIVQDKIRGMEGKFKKKTKEYPEIKPENYFLVKDGRIVKNLEELKRAHKEVDEKTFRHHVNEEKNDFANWVEHVLDDAKLAKKLKKAKTREKSYNVLKRH